MIKTVTTELRDYPLTSTIVKLKNSKVQLTLIQDPDRFLEQLSHEDKHGTLYLPYWTYLWESSIGLARYIESLGSRLKDAPVLEIGCGFGLAGIVACQLGARVIFTDAERAALRFAYHNAEQNGVHEQADFVQMDWNTPCFDRTFPYILAADVIYEEPHWTPIITLLRDHLAPNGTALFSEPSRNNAPGFFKRLSDNGFVHQKTLYPITLDRQTSQVSIYTVHRRPSS